MRDPARHPAAHAAACERAAACEFAHIRARTYASAHGRADLERLQVADVHGLVLRVLLTLLQFLLLLLGPLAPAHRVGFSSRHGEDTVQHGGSAARIGGAGAGSQPAAGQQAAALLPRSLLRF